MLWYVCVYVCKIMYISVPVYCTSVKKQEVTCFCVNCITYCSCIMCRNQLGNRNFKNTSTEGNTVEPWLMIYLGEQAFCTLNQDRIPSKFKCNNVFLQSILYLKLIYLFCRTPKKTYIMKTFYNSILLSVWCMMTNHKTAYSHDLFTMNQEQCCSV